MKPIQELLADPALICLRKYVTENTDTARRFLNERQVETASLFHSHAEGAVFYWSELYADEMRDRPFNEVEQVEAAMNYDAVVDVRDLIHKAFETMYEWCGHE